jgi:hypothetical protein
MPSDGVVEHANLGRKCTEPRDGGLPDVTMLDVPRHDHLVGWEV